MPRGFGRGSSGSGRGAGQGSGRGGGNMGGGRMNAGPGGECVCPSCGATAPHQAGVPCYQTRCPKCGITMARK
jgi:hypothetical protein